ncbi:hypothetical protein OWM07_09430 [Deferribacter thermophilus]|uniref:hypothetical protein n=1 Tax=Deferribacter thermophilus TaxID=53573 RepID=UPI003C1A5557
MTKKIGSLYLFLVTFLLLFGCSLNFNFKSNKTLLKDYKYSQKNDDFIIYYNILRVGDKKKLYLVFKNRKNYVMVNLKIRITDSRKFDRYFYVSRLKASNIKNYELIVPSKVDYVKIEYEYEIAADDTFLNPSNTGQDIKSYEKKGFLELLVK